MRRPMIKNAVESCLCSLMLLANKMSTMSIKTLTGIVLVLLALASAGQAAEPTRIPIRLTKPGKGQLSLGVYDDSGTLIRSLTYAR